MSGGQFGAGDHATVVARTATCVAACDALISASENCADACLALSGNGDVTACFLANLDCVEICTSTSRVLSWHTRTDGPTAAALLDTCVEACRASSTACERMLSHRPGWRSCAPECRRVTEACTDLLAVL
jgi:hypothetical protein